MRNRTRVKKTPPDPHFAINHNCAIAQKSSSYIEALNTQAIGEAQLEQAALHDAATAYGRLGQFLYLSYSPKHLSRSVRPYLAGCDKQHDTNSFAYGSPQCYPVVEILRVFIMCVEFCSTPASSLITKIFTTTCRCQSIAYRRFSCPCSFDRSTFWHDPIPELSASDSAAWAAAILFCPKLL